ncbi:MAG TPA: 16S rRNA (cytidine(1402)-2'-O)-methyltransferase [Candidatus Dojkabacteria bacterium]|nr:16S rRNA (cytidine(1402)-2'-O)-methyltransferase [Candidatus Dojkabacteria bacterium]HQF36678.1 16S rRNA (cytidine(1402)-2'-O)-methyltransferase [Candidatus Dojkabacteria bacterium]
MSKFYIVSTPIGNLKDITLRAIDVLRDVKHIFCEDTRTTGSLLAKYGIKNNLHRYDTINEKVSAPGIINLLNQGLDCALVSDGGTPIISDPGFEVVRLIKSTTSHTIIPIPGASAILSALVASGLPPTPFVFLGFLGKKESQLMEINKHIEDDNTVIFYESPKRIVRTCKYIASKFPSAYVCIARELTKLHEQIITNTAKDTVLLLGNQISIKGEFTVIVRNINR